MKTGETCSGAVLRDIIDIAGQMLDSEFERLAIVAGFDHIARLVGLGESLVDAERDNLTDDAIDDLVEDYWSD